MRIGGSDRFRSGVAPARRNVQRAEFEGNKVPSRRAVPADLPITIKFFRNRTSQFPQLAERVTVAARMAFPPFGPSMTP